MPSNSAPLVTTRPNVIASIFLRSNPRPVRRLLRRKQRSCSETCVSLSLGRCFDNRESEFSRFLFEMRDFALAHLLLIFVGAQRAKRGAMLEHMIIRACNLVGRGHNRLLRPNRARWRRSEAPNSA